MHDIYAVLLSILLIVSVAVLHFLLSFVVRFYRGGGNDGEKCQTKKEKKNENE